MGYMHANTHKRDIFNFKTFLLITALIVIIDTLLYTHVFTILKVIQVKEIEAYLISKDSRSTNSIFCPLYTLFNDTRLIYPDYKNEDPQILSKRLNIQSGGKWKPFSCKSRHLVAIVIPYRNRNVQLQTFMFYIHPFLQHQNIEYQIFLLEQSEQNEFNRGKLFNVGYSEAMKINPFSCFIFHDVDLIPQNVNNIYACTRYPRHMASSVNKDRYVIPYDTYFGGAIAILTFQYKYSNGFSNTFYGWGGEDDDFYNRVRYGGFDICRFESKISRYYALNHKKEKPSNKRFYNLLLGKTRYLEDGLKDLTYSIIKKEYLPLYTRILVNV